ncbi:hypothetical protein SDC9_154277 [bioreactor metagenome]|uniref:Uncharacterized protein n=1 Tax=bioreactor metagenome TaxID=1076179 RepID=A0A645EY95_9ZZZZ
MDKSHPDDSSLITSCSGLLPASVIIFIVASILNSDNNDSMTELYLSRNLALPQRAKTLTLALRQ